mmetsp:Transcript_54590/g.130239  ORF Transcript_54590/g.130239 Transcript_54590/m.130239 type:complete len:542 (-) Transcript_54590:95-1720(-)
MGQAVPFSCNMGQAEAKPQIAPRTGGFSADAFRHFREDDGTWQFRPTTVKDPYADLQTGYNPSRDARGVPPQPHISALGELEPNRAFEPPSYSRPDQPPPPPPQRSASGRSPLGAGSPYSPHQDFSSLGAMPGGDFGQQRHPVEEVSPIARGLGDELRQRTLWAEGSILEVYSARQGGWLVGMVSEVGQPTPDMLTVQFSADGLKLLQKCLSRNDMQLAVFGSNLSDLPPGFQATPSKSRPGDVSYMDTATGAKFQTTELAWRCHYEKMRNMAGSGDVGTPVSRQPRGSGIAMPPAAPSSAARAMPPSASSSEPLQSYRSRGYDVGQSPMSASQSWQQPHASSQDLVHNPAFPAGDARRSFHLDQSASFAESRIGTRNSGSNEAAEADVPTRGRTMSRPEVAPVPSTVGRTPAMPAPPIAPEQQVDNEEERNRVVQAVFDACDRDRNSLLNEEEMRLMVRCMGFQGSDAKWTQLWQTTCKDTGADPAVGLDVKAVAWHMRKAPLTVWLKVLEKLQQEAAAGRAAAMQPVPSSTTSSEVRYF